ncbi:MAG: LacI family DNA-binding transcriptional regulator [Candidatus Promineifilaceae bacterium]
MVRRITIGDVAEAAGVSKQTVSRAVNNKGEISTATKERIMAVVRKLGYRPNRLAQAMNTQRSHMVGLIIPDITNPFFPEVARGVQDAALASDYTSIISNTDEDGVRELEALEQLAAQGADGIIAFSHRASDAALKRFADSFRPIILVNRICEHPNITSLIVDNLKGAQLAVAHFIRRGHQHIGMLTNADFAPHEVRRVQGYQQALIEQGLTASAECLIGAEASLSGGYVATTQLLTDHPQTTAIFCYNDLMAFGAIRAVQNVGKRVPHDIAVIGFDNIQLTAMTTPSLSSVHVDKYHMGQLAFQRALDMLLDPQATNQQIGMDVELILRESTRS